MKDPRDFYKSQIDKYQIQLKKASQKLAFSSLIRLLVFLSIAFLVYYFFGNGPAIVAVLFIGIVVFVFLVSRHSDLKYERDKFQELIRINEIELRVLDRDFHDLPSGEEFEDHSMLFPRMSTFSEKLPSSNSLTGPHFWKVAEHWPRCCCPMIFTIFRRSRRLLKSSLKKLTGDRDFRLLRPS